MYFFKNDYCNICHPKILEGLTLINNQVCSGYGTDHITSNFGQKLAKILNIDNCSFYFIAGGTLANKTIISKVLKPYEAVISTNIGHINVHETGAVEQTGHKILTISHQNGKISLDLLQQKLNDFQSSHMVLPKLLYLSNTTEIGTVYSREELKKIYEFAKEKNLFVFIDGARLSYALATKELDLCDVYNYSDVFYLGGTKIGLPYGELVIIKNSEINENFSYHQKNQGALLSKTFVLAKMFDIILEDDFYVSLGNLANAFANKIRKRVENSLLVEVYNNNTNQVFYKMSRNFYLELIKDIELEIFEEIDANTVIIRLVTSYSTTDLQVNFLIKKLNELK